MLVTPYKATPAQDSLLKRRKQEEQDFIEEHYGKLISNFKSYRLKAGFSLQGLANAARVSKPAVLKAENGIFARPLPSLSTYWERRLGLSLLEITDGYEDYQHEQRQAHRLYFGPSLDIDLSSPVHPFRQLRSQRPSYYDGDVLPVGPGEVAKALCLPTDTIDYWEQKFRQQQSVPKLVAQVLRDTGYTRVQVFEFCSAYKEWRSLHKGVLTSE